MTTWTAEQVTSIQECIWGADEASAMLCYAVLCYAVVSRTESFNNVTGSLKQQYLAVSREE